MITTKFFLEAIFGASLLFSQGVQAIESTPAGANIAGQAPVASAATSELIRRGEYVARLGDCIACHTAPGGNLMAGGLECPRRLNFEPLCRFNFEPGAEANF